MADLNSSRSGRAAETLAAATLLRAGFQIGLPYWDDDECDLLIFWRDGIDYITLPVQVKSVLGKATKGDELPIAGLKRRYVDQNPWLSLFLISHATNRLWFVPGADNIISTYDAWVAKGSKSGKGRKRTPYKSLTATAVVPHRIYTGDDPAKDVNSKWLIDPDTPRPLTDDVIRLVRMVQESRQPK